MKALNGAGHVQYKQYFHSFVGMNIGDGTQDSSGSLFSFCFKSERGDTSLSNHSQETGHNDPLAIVRYVSGDINSNLVVLGHRHA